MADNKRRSNQGGQSQPENSERTGTQQRRRSADSGTPGREKSSKANNAVRHGDDANIEGRQRDRGDALLRGDESTNIDEP